MARTKQTKDFFSERSIKESDIDHPDHSLEMEPYQERDNLDGLRGRSPSVSLNSSIASRYATVIGRNGYAPGGQRKQVYDIVSELAPVGYWEIDTLFSLYPAGKVIQTSVIGWPDLSGNGNTLFRSAGGTPVVFSTATGAVECTNQTAVGAAFALASPIAVAYVGAVRQDFITSGAFPNLADGFTFAKFHIDMTSNGFIRAGNTIISTVIPRRDRKFIIVFSGTDAVSGTLFVNGKKFTGVPSINATPGGFQFGVASGGAGPDQAIYAGLVHNRLLTDDEAIKITIKWAEKYGVQDAFN